MTSGVIEANVLADDCGALRPHLPIGMGGVQLLVKRADLEKAQAILEDSEKPLTNKST